jgi:hemoglobin
MTTVTHKLWMSAWCCICTWAFTSTPAAANDTLYVRLGGEPGVTAIANTLIDRVVANPVTGPSFKDTKLDRIKRLLAEQICDLSGGPCHYSGDPMKDVHAGHQINESMFYVMVETLRDIMRERHIDLRSRNELLRLLAPMKRDVVEPRAATTAVPARNAAPIPAPAGP